jgi:DNA-binding transcriptional ArsR family regulator
MIRAMMNCRSDTGSSNGFSAAELAGIFAALSDPTRIEMLRLLVSGDEVACTTFEAQFPISKSTISYHVKALRCAGLIRVRKEGKYYHYTLCRDEIERQLPGLLALLTSTDSQSASGSLPTTRRSARERPRLVGRPEPLASARATSVVVSQTG